jgi:hypothetical protein
MTAEQETTWSIGQVSELTGLTTHTVRFYEQEGLFFAPVRRNAAGRRVFTAEEVEWLKRSSFTLSACVRARPASSGVTAPNATPGNP